MRKVTRGVRVSSSKQIYSYYQVVQSYFADLDNAAQGDIYDSRRTERMHRTSSKIYKEQLTYKHDPTAPISQAVSNATCEETAMSVYLLRLRYKSHFQEDVTEATT